MKIHEVIKNLVLISQHVDGCSNRAVTNVITRLIKELVGDELFTLLPYFGFSGKNDILATKVREYLAPVHQGFAKIEELEYLLLKCELLQRGYEYSQHHDTYVITTRPQYIMYSITDYAIDVSRYIDASEGKLIKFNLESLGAALIKLKSENTGTEVTKDRNTLVNVADFFLVKTFNQISSLLDDRRDIGILIASYLRNVVGMSSRELLFYGIKPVDAGDVPSKAQAGILHQLGLITHGVYNNEQGFRILTYLGDTVGELMFNEEKNNAWR